MKLYLKKYNYNYENINIVMLNNEHYLINSPFFTYIYNINTDKFIDLAKKVKEYYNLSSDIFLQGNFDLLPDSKNNQTNYLYLQYYGTSFFDSVFKDTLLDDLFTESSLNMTINKNININTINSNLQIKNIIIEYEKCRKILINKVYNHMEKIMKFIINKLNEVLYTEGAHGFSDSPAFKIFGENLDNLRFTMYFNHFYILNNINEQLQKLIVNNMGLLKELNNKYSNYNFATSNMFDMIIPFSFINIKDFDFDKMEAAYILFNLNNNKIIFPKYEDIINMYKNLFMLDSSNFIKNKRHETDFIENPELFNNLRNSLLSKLLNDVKDDIKDLNIKINNNELNSYINYYLNKYIRPKIITLDLDYKYTKIQRFKELFEKMFNYDNQKYENQKEIKSPLYLNKKHNIEFHIYKNNVNVFLKNLIDTQCFIPNKYKLFGLQLNNELSYNIKSMFYYDNKTLKYIDNTYIVSTLLYPLVNNKTLNIDLSLVESKNAIEEKRILKPVKSKSIQKINENKIIYVDSNTSNINSYIENKIKKIVNKKTLYTLMNEHKILKEFNLTDFEI